MDWNIGGGGKLAPSFMLAYPEKLVHTFVSSSLNYYHALIRIPSGSIQELHYSQNTDATDVKIQPHHSRPGWASGVRKEIFIR